METGISSFFSEELLLFLKHWGAWIGVSFGAVLVWFQRFRRQAQINREEQENRILDRERSYSETQTKRIRELHKANEELSKTVIKLRLKATDGQVPPLDIVRQLISADNGLSWAKQRVESSDGKVSFIMIQVSKGYARQYLGGPAEIFTGKTDYEIFSKDIADFFVQNDEHVYRTQQGEFVDEPVKSVLTGAQGRFFGRKYSIRLPGDEDIIIGSGHHIEAASLDKLEVE